MFADAWTAKDMVDTVLSFAATQLIDRVIAGDAEANKMVETLKGDAKARKQMLLLAHL